MSEEHALLLLILIVFSLALISPALWSMRRVQVDAANQFIRALQSIDDRLKVISERLTEK